MRATEENGLNDTTNIGGSIKHVGQNVGGMEVLGKCNRHIDPTNKAREEALMVPLHAPQRLRRKHPEDGHQNIWHPLASCSSGLMRSPSLRLVPPMAKARQRAFVKVPLLVNAVKGKTVWPFTPIVGSNHGMQECEDFGG